MFNNTPVFHDPNDIPDFLHFSSHGILWSILGMLCSLAFVPLFWPSRVFTLNMYAVGLFLVSASTFLNALIWRHDATYIPVFTEIVARSRDILVSINIANSACLVKFMWICSTPSGMIQLYDKRNKLNRTDQIVLAIVVALSILYSAIIPSHTFILQGYGPFRRDTAITFFLWLLIFRWVPAVAIITFGVSGVINLCNFRRSDRWTQLMRTETEVSRTRFKTISHFGFVKRFLSISILVIGSTYDSIATFIAMPGVIKKKTLVLTLTAMAEAMKVQPAIYMWSSKGLTVLRHNAVEYQPIRFQYMDYVPLAAVHMLLFWGTGRQSRALYAEWMRRSRSTLGVDMAWNFICERCRTLKMVQVIREYAHRGRKDGLETAVTPFPMPLERVNRPGTRTGMERDETFYNVEQVQSYPFSSLDDPAICRAVTENQSHAMTRPLSTHKPRFHSQILMNSHERPLSVPTISSTTIDSTRQDNRRDARSGRTSYDLPSIDSHHQNHLERGLPASPGNIPVSNVARQEPRILPRRSPRAEGASSGVPPPYSRGEHRAIHKPSLPPTLRPRSLPRIQLDSRITSDEVRKPPLPPSLRPRNLPEPLLNLPVGIGEIHKSPIPQTLRPLHPPETSPPPNSSSREVHKPPLPPALLPLYASDRQVDSNEMAREVRKPPVSRSAFDSQVQRALGRIMGTTSSWERNTRQHSHCEGSRE